MDGTEDQAKRRTLGGDLCPVDYDRLMIMMMKNDFLENPVGFVQIPS